MPSRAYLRPFLANAKLSWDLEGNWAPAWLYVIFALIPPISGVLMLVFMYLVIMGSTGDPSYLAFLLTGSAAFIFVRLVLSGAGMEVVDDREHYRTFRYIYAAPVPFAVHIFGRVATKVIIASLGATATFVAGALFLGVKVSPTGVNYLALVGSLLIALAGMGALGYMLASLMLIIDRMGWVFAEGISALLYMVSGAIFPLSVLPVQVAFLGKTLPITYWIDLWRLGIYGAGAKVALPGLPLETLWLRLAVTTIFWIGVSMVWYKIADRLARKWGKIELETFY